MFETLSNVWQPKPVPGSNRIARKAQFGCPHNIPSPAALGAHLYAPEWSPQAWVKLPGTDAIPNHAEGGEQVFAQGLGAVGASVAGLVGAALAMPKPKASAIVMGVSAIAGVIFVTVAFIPGAILLLLAALFAFLGRKRG